MKIVLSTRNKHKISEVKSLLENEIGDIDLLSLDDIGFSGDIEENGESFEENAMIKARTVADISKYIVIADDSGLTVDALNGAPGIYSARYSGVFGEKQDSSNNSYLLKNMQGITNRNAAFVCAVACAFPNGSSYEDFTVKGCVFGKILYSAQGENGFGYDPLFWVDELKKTFAEMSPEEKNMYSHRGRAISELSRRLKNIFEI